MTLHPFFAESTARNAEKPSLSSGTPAQARAMVAAGRAALGPGPRMTVVEEVDVPTRRGTVRARLYVPDGSLTALVVYLHGGGWVVGSVDDFDTLARTLADRGRCAVLVPDYSLAPERPFPKGLEDAEDTILWAAHEAAARIGSVLPLVVAGDSAGANLATTAVRRLGDRVQVAEQILVYPITNADFDTPSYRGNSTGMPLTRQDMQWFFRMYAPESLWNHEDISPMRSADLGMLPRTLLITAEHDVLRSDGEMYARALRQAGVDVTHIDYPGMVHGFLRLHNHVDVADLALSDIATAIISIRRSATSMVDSPIRCPRS